MSRTLSSAEPHNVLDRIQRGLAGHISYLAACGMKKTFSEYVLYEPILRILISRGFQAGCEVKCPKIRHASRGDKKRIDFVAEKGNLRFALEVKWAKQEKINIKGDKAKLVAFKSHVEGNRSFLAVFGRQSHIVAMTFDGFDVINDPVFADLFETRYGCLMYELKDAPPPVQAEGN